MNDRIHQWLDGELPFEALGPEEREKGRRMAAAVERAAAAAADVASPRLASRVMAGLPPGVPARRRSLLSRLRPAVWLRSPALRPAMAAATLSLLAGFGLGVWTGSTGDSGGSRTAAATQAPATPQRTTIYVRFDVRLPDAQRVALAGSFTEWQPAYELTPAGADRWTVTVPLRPGVHDYVFVVDGSRQVLDPAAPAIEDGFGSYNNRIAVLTTPT